MKSKHSTAFDIVTTFITKIFFLGGSFIISIILARLLGPEGKGIVTALFVIPNMLVSLADLGVRQVSAYYIGQKKYSIQEIVSSSLILWIATSLMSMVVMFVYYNLPGTPNYSWILISIAIAYIPFKILVSYFNGILQGQQKILNMNVKFMIEFVVRLLAVILLVWIFNFDVVGAALSILLTTLAVLVYSGSIIRKTAKLSFKYIKGIPQDMLRKGIVFAVALFIIKLNYKVDILFLERMVSASELGIYTVGVNISELLWELPTAMSVVLFARSANAKSNKESTNRSAKLLRITWIPLLLGALVLWIFAPFLVSLVYGQEFVLAGNVMRVLLPGTVVMVLFKILNADLSGRGKPLFAVKIYIVALTINIILNYLLIPMYGMYGAAMASTISYIIGGIVFSIAYHRYTGLPYKELFILNNEDIDLIKSIFAKWTKRKNKGDNNE